jgi:hypothetical protein
MVAHLFLASRANGVNMAQSGSRVKAPKVIGQATINIENIGF